MRSFQTGRATADAYLKRASSPWAVIGSSACTAEATNQIMLNKSFFFLAKIPWGEAAGRGAKPLNTESDPAEHHGQKRRKTVCILLIKGIRLVAVDIQNRNQFTCCIPDRKNQLRTGG